MLDYIEYFVIYRMSIILYIEWYTKDTNLISRNWYCIEFLHCLGCSPLPEPRTLSCQIKSNKFTVATELKAPMLDFFYEHSERIWRMENITRLLKSYCHEIFRIIRSLCWPRSWKNTAKWNIKLKHFLGKPMASCIEKEKTVQSRTSPMLTRQEGI